MTDKFNLKHTVLYAKSWYIRSDDIISDLCKCLEADGYIIRGKFEVFSMLINGLYSTKHLSDNKSTQMVIECAPENSWKFGYYNTSTPSIFKHTDSLEEYDYHLSYIYWCLSEIGMMDKTKCDICIPNEDVLPVIEDGIKRIKKLLNS